MLTPIHQTASLHKFPAQGTLLFGHDLSCMRDTGYGCGSSMSILSAVSSCFVSKKRVTPPHKKYVITNT